jgi:anti-anti-sigma factor
MELTLQSHVAGDAVVMRCRGRIVFGDEIRSLQAEVEKATKFIKRVVLHLSDVNYIDSAGLGALIRLFGVLRAAGGDLKLCQPSPFLLQVLQASNLISVLRTYDSESEAIAAFSEGARPAEDLSGASKTRILCIDTSSDLLAYVNALLKRSGYEVFTTRHTSDAMTLMGAARPRMLICGPGLSALPAREAVVEKFRQSGPNVHILHLPPDFSTAEAGQAGADLVTRVRSLLTT